MQRGFCLGLAIVLSCAAGVAPSSAATSEQGASVLIFPRVVADGQRDTVVQIVNGSNLPIHATCFYVGTEATASILLQPKQPTHWSAARGRQVNPTDPVCFGDGIRVLLADCDGAGFDPGDVPPAPPSFDGTLVCVQTDASGAPASGNGLYGVATLIDRAGGQVEKYFAFGLRGFETNDGGADLCVGGSASASCPQGAEYEGCPFRWHLVHPTDGEAADAADSRTSITVVTCAQDLLSREPTAIELSLAVTNEFEQRFLAAAEVLGNATLHLADVSPVFQRSVLGGDVGRTEISSVDQRGFVALLEIERTTPAGTAISAVNLHGEPSQISAETIRVPQ